MPRIPRSALVFPEHTYHVIARGSGRMTIFRDAEDYAAYLKFLDIGLKQCGIDLFHYVLMPNHFHLLVRPTEDNLSACMHYVQLVYAKRFCKKYRRVGHVWQGRYKSHLIANDSYLFACGNYIEMNPVRAKLVEAPEGWRFSSYQHYASRKKDRLVTTDPFYRSLGATEEERQREYKKNNARTRR
jgi:putative transposase